MPSILKPDVLCVYHRIYSDVQRLQRNQQGQHFAASISVLAGILVRLLPRGDTHFVGFKIGLWKLVNEKKT